MQKTRSRCTSVRRFWVAPAIGLALALSACAGSTTANAPAATNQVAATTPTEVSPSGDVPDNAVFVNYQSNEGGYALQYVEGWTVKPGGRGAVNITDIDSAEQVELKPLPSGDLQQYVTATDEAQVKAQAQDYKRTGLETLTVNQLNVAKLTYTWTAAPDPVTNKRRAVITDRYYIPGPKQLAVLTLTTPDGVDNVDAFRQMLESFTWTQ